MMGPKLVQKIRAQARNGRQIARIARAVGRAYTTVRDVVTGRTHRKVPNADGSPAFETAQKSPCGEW